MRLVYGALLAGAMVPPLGRWLGAKGSPRAGAWILAILCGFVAFASLWACILLSGTLLEDVVGAHSAESGEPVSDAEGYFGLALLVLAVARVANGVRVNRRMRRALVGVCGDTPTQLVIVADDDAYAFAVPGSALRGRDWRILVSEGMLRVLNRRQRRVLFAHERAHLRFGHHRFQLLAQVAGEINPLLAQAEGAMAFLCERWADEQAAAEVGDRRLTARSLGAAALAVPDSTSGSAAAAPAFHEHEVTRRVKALLRPPLGVLPLACVAAVILIITTGAEDVDATFQLAGYLATFLV